ncbi:MAG: RagB/SusD family nutrient uptake outer membrane protein [Chitinophagaceae bacterium]|nr:RagB/SusD family nutrient uptake outer membrane protein [Chitinophagaceae bacterium]
MKKYITGLHFFALLMLFSACKKNSILDKTPQDQYSESVLWSDIGLVDSYVVDAYHSTAIGFSQHMLSSVSDEAHSTFDHGVEVYVQGNISKDNTAPWDPTEYSFPSWNTYFSNIQKLNVLIEKIDQVAEAYPEAERAAIKLRSDVMKGEGYFLRAFCYTQLMRMYGGVPVLKEALTLNDDFSSITRGSFEETVSLISADCDMAAGLLPPAADAPAGRATKGAALALKSRALLFAASDLTADGSAANKYVGYEHADRTALWTAARDAAKAVIDLGTYHLENFGAPDKAAVAKNYFNFFKAKTLSSSEVIWGKQYSLSNGDKNMVNQWNGGNGWALWASNAPTQNLVDAYEMEDGTDFFDHFKIDGNGYYKNISSHFHNENPYYNRDPRFYGSILYDSALWMPRSPGLQAIDPVGVYDRRTRIVMSGSTVVSKSFGLDTRQGPTSGFNGSFTGYVMKKMLDNEIDASVQPNENVWIEMRYPEVLLNYAEASLALGETGVAADYINMVRNRAGLPGFTGDITAALRYERRIELVFENQRWYDIRRWKILDKGLENAKGMDITETITNGNSVTVWKQIPVETRQALQKMYWLPIASDEMRKAPQLEQNPQY